MENCLVTKLKGSVNNDHLLKFGEFRVKIGAAKYLGFAADDSQIISVVDGNLLFNGQPTLQLTDNFQSTVNITGEGTVSIPNKYNLTILEASFKEQIDLEKLRYCTKLRTISLSGSGFTYNLDDINIESSVLKNVTIQNVDSIKGSIRNLLKYPLTSLKLNVNLKSFNENNFSVLGEFAECTNYDNTVSGSGLTGSIEDFVAQKRLARTAAGLEVAGTCTFRYLGDGRRITFQGTPVTNVNDNTISWTANTITYNGTTIDA
jgi:hypothetical protein